MLQEAVDSEVKLLLALKGKFKSITGKDWKPGVEVSVVEKKPTISETVSSESVEKILASITQQGDKIRQLKSAKADKNVVDVEVKALLALKAKYKEVTGEDWKPNAQPPAKTEPIKMSAPAVNGDNATELQEKITKQGDKVRELKSQSASKVNVLSPLCFTINSLTLTAVMLVQEVVDKEVKILLDLKAQYKEATGKDFQPASAPRGGGKKEAKPKPAQQTKKQQPKEKSAEVILIQISFFIYNTF
jgi:bifunctional glutamyl/prolyl-tRNA synthetase